MSKKIEIEVHDILYEALEERAKERNLNLNGLINLMLVDCFKERWKRKKRKSNPSMWQIQVCDVLLTEQTGLGIIMSEMTPLEAYNEGKRKKERCFTQNVFCKLLLQKLQNKNVGCCKTVL